MGEFTLRFPSANNPSKIIDEQENDAAPCEYITSQPDSMAVMVDNLKAVQEVTYGQYVLKYVTQKNIKDEVDILTHANKCNVDILPGRYEGGFKAWQCSFDLAKFLCEQGNIVKLGHKVLELGCGVGLPGLAAYHMGADVTFQDYNRDVLRLLTMPNVQLNRADAKGGGTCQFLAGDWGHIRQMEFPSTPADPAEQENKQYDVILTSETLYERNSFPKLIGLMKAALKPDGHIYVASKQHYFGNGAGLADFEALVREERHFETESVLSICDQGLVREIIKMTHRRS